MTSIPIVEHFEARVDEARTARAEALAARLLREQPRLKLNEALRPLVLRRLGDVPTLHLDDLTGIALLDRFHDVSYAEDRARLRAGDGDLVASCTPPAPDFEHYCARNLALGSVQWLHPRPRSDPKAVASACWADAGVRAKLIENLRAGSYRRLHPHMGNHAAWSLAVLLSKASGRRLKVLAPHPGLTSAVNDKNWFADTVSRLLGKHCIPRTMRAYNLAGLAHVLRFLARDSETLAVKVPDSGGGAGTVLVGARDVRALPLGSLKDALNKRLQPLRWRPGDALLASSWESRSVEPLSCQLWIPPEPEGPPVVEGIFRQIIEKNIFFVGAGPAELPAELAQELVDESWLLGRLFQRLGYLGRCSFDAVRSMGNGGDKLKLVECNGRWGGTSGPMTLMNRLFGDWAARPFATRRCQAEGLGQFAFAELLDCFAEDLYDSGTDRGRLILYNPAGLRGASRINVVALGKDLQDAARRELPRFQAGLERLAGTRVVEARSDAPAEPVGRRSLARP